MLVIKISNNDKLKQTKIRQSGRKTFITYESEHWFIFRCTKKTGQETLHQKQGGRPVQTAKNPRKRCSDFSFWKVAT